MGRVRTVRSLSELQSAIREDLAALRNKAVKACERTAEEGVAIPRAKAPTAFGELRMSIDPKSTAGGATIRADAPHAAALEIGTRPHWPDIVKLTQWVRLRATQAQNVYASGGRPRGQVRQVHSAIRKLSTRRASPIDAPDKVAYAIASVIARRGTKPTWYMKRSLPKLMQLLHVNMLALKSLSPYGEWSLGALASSMVAQ